jgi:hypothetical protein
MLILVLLGMYFDAAVLFVTFIGSGHTVISGESAKHFHGFGLGPLSKICIVC